MRLLTGGATSSATVAIRQSTLDDLLDEVTALEAEALDMADRALPLARQLAIMATALGPTSSAIGRELVNLLERQARRHPERAA